MVCTDSYGELRCYKMNAPLETNMKISKWYQVLVMGGASLLQTGCGGTEAQALDMGGSPASDVETEQSTDQAVDTADSQPSVDSAAVSSSRDASNMADGMQANDAATVRDMSVPDAAVADAAAVDLACADPADPADACGCPCCWAVGFLNSDPECDGFCSAGNGGAGCCPE